ncbi:MAG: hypothetical protein UX64_C0040G0003 [Microgenomates group bacterium GW2011_GWC2_46_7]|nr:MAG: hypothetical protein UX64_C0040G0003 [Microgenomates group bacterium GW2011_GWC2_46_7]
MIRHVSDYSLLALLAVIYISSIFRYQSTPQYLLFATIIFAVLYFIWGIFHHLHTGSFHPRVVLEYLLVALLGLALVSTLLI